MRLIGGLAIVIATLGVMYLVHLAGGASEKWAALAKRCEDAGGVMLYDGRGMMVSCVKKEAVIREW